MINLKKCPFCGHDATIKTYDADENGGKYKVVCTNSNCPAESWREKSQLLAAEWWNTRNKEVENE